MADIAELQSTQQTASTDLSNLQTSIPGLLQGLRQNLVSIYAKDNPLIQARDEALSRFLSGGDVARAELLPGNLPQVAGSPLTLSPTQQNAIVSSRQGANLAPLMGLNQAVSQGYGNIGDIVKGAGDIYGSQVQAATTNLAQAVRDYENAISQNRWEKEQAEKTRQFNIEEARKGKESDNILQNIQALQAWVAAQQGQGTTAPARPDPAQFDEPDQPTQITIPGQGTIQPYTPSAISSPSGRWNPLAQLGAIPELLFGRRAPVTTATSLNLLGQSNYGPFKQ